MIVRVWRGRTRSNDSARYESYLRNYEGYRKTPGYEGAFLLRRPQGAETEFVLVSFWRSMGAIEQYAGPDAQRANLHDEDKALLTYGDATAAHFDLAFDDRNYERRRSIP